MTRQSERKVQPKYIVVGLIILAASVGVEVFYPELKMAHAPSSLMHYLLIGIRGLGIGFVVGAFIGRKPKAAVERN